MEFLSEEHKAFWLDMWKISPEKAEEEWAKKVAMHRGEYQAPDAIMDVPGYVSPVTGKWIEGKKQRRDDLARSGSRPWEGREAEVKEANRRKMYDEQKQDAKLHEAAARAFYAMPESKRRELSRG